MEGSSAPKSSSIDIIQAAPPSAVLDAAQLKVVTAPESKTVDALADRTEGDASPSSKPVGSEDNIENDDTERNAEHETEQSSAHPEPVRSKSPVQTAASQEVDYATWDFEPPLANIRRLLKAHLSKTTNISKDSVTVLSRAAGIFILYLSSCATDIAREGKRSTIAAKDVMAALKELDLEDFIPELEQFMVEHKKYEATKKNEKDLNKKLKGARGADGKYVAPVVDGDVKEDEKDDTDGEANDEEKLASDIVDVLQTKHDLEREDRDDVKRMKLE